MTEILSGTDTLVRLLLLRQRLDERDGLTTATMVSGYPGSPLGGSVPLVNMLLGEVAFGGLGTIGGYGLDAGFLDQIRRGVQEGTSALFLMTSDAVLDRVASGMKDLQFEIFAMNLSAEQERELREALGEIRLSAAR